MKGKPLYTDRDYLDSQFSEIKEEMAGIKQILLGNGEDGLVKKVVHNEDILGDIAARLQGWVWFLWALAIFIFITHAEPAVEFVTDLFKKKL